MHMFDEKALLRCSSVNAFSTVYCMSNIKPPCNMLYVIDVYLHLYLIDTSIFIVFAFNKLKNECSRFPFISAIEHRNLY